MKKARWWLAAVLLLSVMGASALGEESTQTGSWKIEMTGRKTWTVRYGLGDSLALALASVGAGQLSLDQTMAVDFTASALSVFRVKGHFNDQEPDDMQSLSLYYDAENVHGVVGDFSAPSLGAYFSGSRTMKGARVDVTWDGGDAVGIASQLSGIRETRQFVGDTASSDVTYSGRREEGTSYATSLDGLGYFELRELYVEGFTEVRLVLPSGAAVAPTLQHYGVDDLAPALVEYQGHVVDTDEAIVVGTATQFLLLRAEPENLTREALREAIRDYNKTTDDDVTYPFVVGSDVESEFLAEIEAQSRILVGEEERGMAELRWQRFYDLGQAGIEPDSAAASISLDGESFVAVGDPSLTDYSVTVYEEEGILEAAFPEPFFAAPDAALEVTFSYVVTGGAYFLGAASIIPGSERVSLNGTLLVKDQDYSIDYEIGMLVLTGEVGPREVLVVEFERYSAGGGSGSYARGFYGATTSLSVSDDLSITTYALRASDLRASVTHPETVKTMPNTQTVLGVSGSVHRANLDADFDVGYGVDVFPYDDNARNRVANRVRAIAAADGIVFVGSDAGFSALDAGVWRAYDGASGLSGREVRAIAADVDRVIFGTSGGLTVVKLTGVAPLDKVANWSRYGLEEGLHNVSVRAMAQDGDMLWVGTDGGLSRIALADLGDPDAWTTYEDARLENVRALCVAGAGVYVGTTEGLLRVDAASGRVDAVDVDGSAVLALAWDGEVLYAAGEEGVEQIVADAGAGWLLHGEAASAVAVVDGDVLVGTESGVLRVSDGTVAHAEWAITALAVSDGEVWMGTAGRDGELAIFRQDGGETTFDAETTGIDPWNPRVYSDSPAAEHTDTGWTAVASFAHEEDGFSLAGSVDRVLEGFRAIDARGRSNAGGWSLTSDIALGPAATLSLETSYRLEDIDSKDAEATSDNRLVLRGSFGPEITLSVGYTAEDLSPELRGFERNGLGYEFSLSHRLFDDALRVSIDWGEDLRWDDGRPLRTSTSLATTATLDVLPNLTTTLSWQRPIRIVEDTIAGTERVQWRTDGSMDLSMLGVAATYELDASRSVPDGAAACVHKATLNVTLDPLEVGTWSIGPTLDLEGGYAEEAMSLSGRLSVRVGTEELTTRTVATVDASGLGSNVVRLTEKLNASANYTGIEGLRPLVSYSGSRTVTSVEGHGSKESWTQSMTGRLTWSGEGGTADNLSVSGRLQDTGTATLSLENAFSFDITSTVVGWFPALGDVASGAGQSVTVRTDVAGDWRHQTETDDVSWHLGATADMALSSTWSLSVGLAYYGGVKTDVDMFHGLVIEVTAAIDFDLATSSAEPAPTPAG